MKKNITEKVKKDTNPIIKTKIGSTEYSIRMNFRADAKETMNDKVRRMIKKDIENM